MVRMPGEVPVPVDIPAAVCRRACSECVSSEFRYMDAAGKTITIARPTDVDSVPVLRYWKFRYLVHTWY